jgi:hypothetical protein
MKTSSIVAIMAWAVFYLMILARFFGLVEWDLSSAILTVSAVVLAVIISILHLASSSPTEEEK